MHFSQVMAGHICRTRANVYSLAHLLLVSPEQLVAKLLAFDVWLGSGTHQLCLEHKSWMGCIRTFTPILGIPNLASSFVAQKASYGQTAIHKRPI